MKTTQEIPCCKDTDSKHANIDKGAEQDRQAVPPWKMTVLISNLYNNDVQWNIPSERKSHTLTGIVLSQDVCMLR